ncbi:UNVERIFIED_CONTAM: hypothetical protein NCL1_39849 [Trichonephila clavipes]
MDDKAYTPFFDVTTRQESELWVFENDSAPTMKYGIDQIHQVGRTENSNSKPSPDNEHSVAFSQRFSSPRLIEDETFNDNDIINNLINYEDGREARVLES